MRFTYYIFLISTIYILSVSVSTRACTTAVISAKATADGRPIIFKNRDSGFVQNKLMTFNDGRFTYLGLVNAKDQEGKEIWAGVNNAGFAIMNSQSYNLNINDTTRLKDQEGVIMKEALRTCATLADFENMLDRWPKPMGVEANFGVIDAGGGAAYYETSNFVFKKIDANDPAVAPFGYLIRTNYSFSEPADEGYGYIRYMTAASLLDQAAARNDLSCQFLLQRVSRSLKHSLQDIDLTEMTDLSEDQPRFVCFEDYIPRHSSVSAMAVQGVRPGEPAELSTAWTILGFPLCAVAVPAWVDAAPLLPSILAAGDNGQAPICQLALELKKKCFPISRGSGKKYINLSSLMNKERTGIMQKLPEIENELFKMGEEHLDGWRQRGKIEKEKVKILYQNISDFVLRKYKTFFTLELTPGRL